MCASPSASCFNWTSRSGLILASEPALDALAATPDLLYGLLHGRSGFARLLRLVPNLIILPTCPTGSILLTPSSSLFPCHPAFSLLRPQRATKAAVPSDGSSLFGENIRPSRSPYRPLRRNEPHRPCLYAVQLGGEFGMAVEW